MANRVLIFTTDVTSFHGHPEPMRCPEGVSRRSLALYYFSIEDDPLVRSTEYRARPGDGAHSIMIYADKQMLRVYDWAKRHLGLSDQTASKILGYRDRLRRRGPKGPNGSPHHCCTHGDERARRPTFAFRPAGRRARPAELSRRRFTIAVVDRHRGDGRALPVPAVGPVVRRRSIRSGGCPYDNFYDLQARAMFHGHLDLPGARWASRPSSTTAAQYTYFGIFPSLIRMPILLVTSAFDGDLTAPSILAGLARHRAVHLADAVAPPGPDAGAALVGRLEAVAYGVFMATIMGGSVLIFLAATPFIYNEDFAWSVPLTIGSLFALLGVMERPSWGRVAAAGVLVLCTNLDRTPDRLRLRDRCLPGRRLVRPRARRSGQTTVGRPDGRPWGSCRSRRAAP